MSEAEIIAAIKIHIPARADVNADVVAASLLKKAILKVGRTPSVHWNRTEVEFSLKADRSRYQLGKDIMADTRTIKNMQYLWCTDTPGEPITIVSVDEFSRYARGSSRSGRPEIATLHSKDKILEFWPSPGSAYTLWGYAMNKITSLDGIPDEYHDVLVDYAVASMRADSALPMAAEGLREARADALTQWDEDTIPIIRHVGQTSRRTRADSHNLRGD